MIDPTTVSDGNSDHALKVPRADVNHGKLATSLVDSSATGSIGAKSLARFVSAHNEKTLYASPAAVSPTTTVAKAIQSVETGKNERNSTRSHQLVSLKSSTQPLGLLASAKDHLPEQHATYAQIAVRTKAASEPAPESKAPSPTSRSDSAVDHTTKQQIDSSSVDSKASENVPLPLRSAHSQSPPTAAASGPIDAVMESVTTNPTVRSTLVNGRWSMDLPQTVTATNPVRPTQRNGSNQSPKETLVGDRSPKDAPKVVSANRVAKGPTVDRAIPSRGDVVVARPESHHATSTSHSDELPSDGIAAADHSIGAGTESNGSLGAAHAASLTHSSAETTRSDFPPTTQHTVVSTLDRLPERILETVANHVELSLSSGSEMTSRIRVDLDPPDLGSLTVIVDGSQHGTRVTIHAESAETQVLLEQNSKSLVEALNKAGVSLQDLDIGHGRQSFSHGHDRWQPPVPPPLSGSRTTRFRSPMSVGPHQIQIIA